jgi:4-azaleucine resistance transporter AzlC
MKQPDTNTTSRFASFLKGCVAVSPLTLGVAPWGLACGATSIESGYSVFESIAMSSIIFAGASQLVVTQLTAEGASLIVILLSGVMINLRMLMYSASISPHFEGSSTPTRSMLAYFLTDQAYATSIAHYEKVENHSLQKCWFYLGAGAFMWFVFNLTTAIGAFTGAAFPSHWEIGFTVPLCFIALLIPQMKTKTDRMVASIAAIAALIAHQLPLGTGLILGSLIGISCGYFWETLRNNERV